MALLRDLQKCVEEVRKQLFRGNAEGCFREIVAQLGALSREAVSSVSKDLGVVSTLVSSGEMDRLPDLYQCLT